jgi:hypothetical protein
VLFSGRWCDTEIGGHGTAVRDCALVCAGAMEVKFRVFLFEIFCVRREFVGTYERHLMVLLSCRARLL